MIELDENELFELKQKFLREIPHPKLITKQIKRLDPSFLPNVFKFEETHELGPFLADYLTRLLELKLKISHAKSASETRELLIELLELQESLINQLSKYMFDTEEQFTDIKQSDPLDTYAYQKELRENELRENEIKTYLCSQSELEQKSALFKGVVRAWKIRENGR